MENILNLSATDLSNAIKNREVSCVDVMQSYLTQIDKINPIVNAIVAIRDIDELLAEAKQKDKDLENGFYQGFMHGFPHAVKDLDAVKGIATTMGSSIFKNWIPDADQIHVERMRASGAIIIGKTNVPEFGLGSQTYNNVYGATKCAYDITKTAGGSSGGAACALATKMLPVADGSDMMGSLRNPAAYNNIIGFRPSQGRIPIGPKSEFWYSQLGCLGPMGRNVKDVAMLFSVQAGYDPRSPLSIAESGAQFANNLDMEVKELKVGWLGSFDNYLPIEPDILKMCETSLKVFENLGAKVSEVKCEFDMESLWKCWNTLRQFEVMGVTKDLYDDEAKRKQMKPEAIWEIESGLKLSAVDVYKASIVRSKWCNYLSELYKNFDCLILPSAQVFPFDVNTHWPRNINGRTMDTYHRWMEVTIMATLGGLPAINVPIGFNNKGLPMGMQIIGGQLNDFKVLQIANAYEKNTQWLKVMPDVIKN